MSTRNGSCHRARWLVTGAALVAAAPLAAQVDWMPARLLAHDMATMAYDQDRDRMVVVGTAYGTGLRPITAHTTWEGDGGAWFERASATSPTAREVMGLAYDAARRKTVLFGGFTGTAALDDTWLWDGDTWTLAPTPIRPSPRHCYTLAYDAARQQVVLFGGWPGGGPLLGDTWTWDGANWTQPPTPNSPLARASHSMAYDAARQEVVLFGGGRGNGTLLNDTWTWNGSSWTQRVLSSTIPLPRGGHGLAYDSARQVVVLFGGWINNTFQASNETWEWDGISWTLHSPPTSPAGRYFHGMAYRPGTGTVVTCGFGGYNGSLLVPAPSDTWSWDGTAWTLREPAQAPPERAEHAAAFDPVRQRSVVFGGSYLTYLSSGLRQDTAEWDGAAWHELTPPGSPSARRWTAMAWDGVNQQSLLFGGYAPSTNLGDTWLWNGATWTNANPSNSPTARRMHAMAWDPARNQVVLFGGVDAAVRGDTWIWDGNTWTQIPVPGPTARSGHAMAFDGVSQTVLLFGGLPLSGQTWQWNGAAWTLVNPSNSPTARYRHAMAHDPVRNVVVLTAGRDGTGALEDAWEWNGTTWQQTLPIGLPARDSHTMTFDALDRMVVFGGSSASGTMSWTNGDTWLYGVLRPATVSTSGTGCPNPLGAPVITGSVPQLGGDRFALDLLNAPPTALCALAVGFVKASTPVGPCTLYVGLNGPHVSLLRTTNATGFATMSLQIPLAPIFMGRPLTAQGVALDPTVPGGLSFSPALDLVVGH